MKSWVYRSLGIRQGHWTACVPRLLPPAPRNEARSLDGLCYYYIVVPLLQKLGIVSTRNDAEYGIQNRIHSLFQVSVMEGGRG